MADGRNMSIDERVGEREQDFITVPDAARRLGRSKLSLYQACGRGEVPGAFKIGAKWLVNWSAFVKATETARGVMTETVIQS
jgi:predicted DNA-binding transcriptional regulator AlpA